MELKKVDELIEKSDEMGKLFQEEGEGAMAYSLFEVRQELEAVRDHVYLKNEYGYEMSGYLYSYLYTLRSNSTHVDFSFYRSWPKDCYYHFSPDPKPTDELLMAKILYCFDDQWLFEKYFNEIVSCYKPDFVDSDHRLLLWYAKNENAIRFYKDPNVCYEKYKKILEESQLDMDIEKTKEKLAQLQAAKAAMGRPSKRKYKHEYEEEDL